MSSPYWLEHLADIREGARRMVERTRAHEDDLNYLVDMAEEVARRATALGVALTRADTNADGLRRLCSDQARLSVENAEATVRPRVSSRQLKPLGNRVKAIAAGHRARGCSERRQFVAIARPDVLDGPDERQRNQAR